MNRVLGMALVFCPLVAIGTVWAQDEASPPIREESAERIERLSERGPVTVPWIRN